MSQPLLTPTARSPPGQEEAGHGDAPLQAQVARQRIHRCQQGGAQYGHMLKCTGPTATPRTSAQAWNNLVTATTLPRTAATALWHEQPRRPISRACTSTHLGGACTALPPGGAVVQRHGDVDDDGVAGALLQLLKCGAAPAAFCKGSTGCEGWIAALHAHVEGAKRADLHDCAEAVGRQRLRRREKFAGCRGKGGRHIQAFARRDNLQVCFPCTLTTRPTKIIGLRDGGLPCPFLMFYAVWAAAAATQRPIAPSAAFSVAGEADKPSRLSPALAERGGRTAPPGRSGGRRPGSRCLKQSISAPMTCCYHPMTCCHRDCLKRPAQMRGLKAPQKLPRKCRT